jgi:imidazole glycerol phosphate synthase glutamine amidotransferase subunit
MLEGRPLERPVAIDEGSAVITILDYGAGNLRSVQNTLAELSCDHTLASTPEALSTATKILLPGVGHFGQMMRALDAMSLRETLLEKLRAGVPFFGICLGMQALFDWSEEAPEVRGLGLYPGVVRRFPASARVPHMGWNELSGAAIPGCSRLSGGHARYVYFAHSYYVPECPQTNAACTYADVRFTAMLGAGNVRGVQFHPEKSGATGLAIVKDFLEC